MVEKKETFGLCPLALFEDVCHFFVYLGAHHWRYFTRAGIWAADTGVQHSDMFSVLAEAGLIFGLWKGSEEVDSWTAISEWTEMWHTNNT